MNIAVAQSGGPTAAINSSLCGVFDEAEKYNEIGRIAILTGRQTMYMALKRIIDL